MKIIKYLPLILIIALIAYSFGFKLSEILFTEVSIQQIQFKPADSLAVGRDKSDMLGDSVNFVARVVASPRVNPANGDLRIMLRGSSSFTCYAQDTANGVFGGIVIRQNTRNVNTGLDLIDSGAVIRVKGVVSEYGGNNFPYSGAGYLTQLYLDTNASYTIDILSPTGPRPEPTQVQITDFAQGDYPNGGTINYVDGEKYEGMYVEIQNVTVSTGVGNRQPWSIIDGNGNKLYFRDYSNWFSTYPSGDSLRPWTHPSVGTFVNYIRGVIISANNEGAFGNQLPYAIVPIFPNDLSLGNAPPIISSPSRIPGVPTPIDSVQITCTVTDPAFNPISVTDVKLFWRHNNGAYSNKNMTAIGNIYTAKMPPASLTTLVEYFIRAQDNDGDIKLLPADTARSKLFYIVHSSDSLSIQDVQYCPNMGGYSGFSGADVRGVEGIVTADTSDIPGISFTGNGGTQTSPRRVIIQNGTGPFSGIWITGTPTDGLNKGDRVRVSGTVEENYGVTRVNVPSPSNITFISSGNPQPSVENLNTSILAKTKQGGDTTVEKWESVFVRLNSPVGITCINAGNGVACTTQEPLPDSTFRRNYGEIFVRDYTGPESRIELQDGNHSYTNNWSGDTTGLILLTKNDSISFIQGILYFSFSNWKLVPRKNNDFGTVSPVGITFSSEIIHNYYLSQNYPNPFNPVTKIKFSLPISANVSLKVYDVIGREVKIILNQQTKAGNYIVDFNGSRLASGVYFYKLYAEGTDGSKFSDVKRMILVK
jgi:DNA/RNA endonuclease YhcR with UshA esterase domain